MNCITFVSVPQRRFTHTTAKAFPANSKRLGHGKRARAPRVRTADRPLLQSCPVKCCLASDRSKSVTVSSVSITRSKLLSRVKRKTTSLDYCTDFIHTWARDDAESWQRKRNPRAENMAMALVRSLSWRKKTSGSPSVPIKTLSPHGCSAPECLSLLIPDKPEPPAQRGEGWMDRTRETTERGGGGRKPRAERVGGIEEFAELWGTNKRAKPEISSGWWWWCRGVRACVCMWNKDFQL